MPILIAAGCAGKAPVQSGDDGDDQPEIDAPTGDAPVIPEGQALSGKVMDYFANAPTPVPEAMIATDGITPQQTVTGAATDSLYTMTVPTGSKLYLTASHALYRPTRNLPASIEGMPVTMDLYAMTIQDVKTHGYTPLGKTPLAGTAFVTVELQKNNGTPLVDVPLANIKLLDMASPPAPVAGVTPYFYNTDGNLDALETTSKAYGLPLRARVGFIDIPPGNYQMSVTYPNGGGTDVTELVAISTTADGATLAKTGNLGGAGTGTNNDPLFTTDIYPRLQTAAKGGLGCANCHTAAGTAAILPYDGTATATLDLIKAAPGVLDLIAPANSLFLTKPLYEPTPPQNHPNATFLDINDLDYKMFLLWITNGAKP